MENQTPERKKRVLSLIQPTAVPTIGNYFGALKNWKAMSEDYNCLYAVADLHALTIHPDPAKLRQQIMEMYAILLSIGLDPENGDGFNFVAGQSVDYVNKKAFLGTLMAHYDGGVPNIVISMEKKGAQNGEYIKK